MPLGMRQMVKQKERSSDMPMQRTSALRYTTQRLPYSFCSLHF